MERFAGDLWISSSVEFNYFYFILNADSYSGSLSLALHPSYKEIVHEWLLITVWKNLPARWNLPIWRCLLPDGHRFWQIYRRSPSVLQFDFLVSSQYNKFQFQSSLLWCLPAKKLKRDGIVSVERSAYIYNELSMHWQHRQEKTHWC